MSDSKTVLLLVEDIFFVARIESMAEKMGLDLEIFDPAASETQQDFLAVMQSLAPQLIVLDLNHREIPWEDWLKALKADSDLSHISVLAFGSHKDVAVMKKANDAGADQVVAKSRFVQEMATLIEKHL